MAVAASLLHPGKGEQQAVAVFRFVRKLTVQQLIGTLHGATLYHPVATDDAVDNMDVLGRRTNLYGDGLSVAWKLIVGDVEPVVGLHDRPLIVEREDGERTLHRVTMADGLYLVAPTLHLRQLDGRTGLCRQPLRSIHAVLHGRSYIVAGRIAQVEHYGLQLVKAHLLSNVDGKGGLAITQRQRLLGVVGLAADVGHISTAYEVIESGIVGLRQTHRHLYRERAIGSGHRLALGHIFIFGILADDAHIPV